MRCNIIDICRNILGNLNRRRQMTLIWFRCLHEISSTCHIAESWWKFILFLNLLIIEIVVHLTRLRLCNYCLWWVRAWVGFELAYSWSKTRHWHQLVAKTEGGSIFFWVFGIFFLGKYLLIFKMRLVYNFRLIQTKFFMIIIFLFYSSTNWSTWLVLHKLVRACVFDWVFLHFFVVGDCLCDYIWFLLNILILRLSIYLLSNKLITILKLLDI